MKAARSRQEWNQIFRAREESGLSVRSWCHQNQFPENSYRYWYKKLGKNQESQLQFVEMTIPSQTSHYNGGYPFIIHYRDCTIEVSRTADSRKVAEIMQCLTDIC